ncbi:hypothetical protein BH11ACT5_BH11ACT5_21870 [soil metagenome]
MSERTSPEQHYDDNVARFERLAEEVEFALKQALEATDIKYLSASVRVKDRESYLQKILRKAYEQPLEQVEDLVGGRVVCYFVTDLPRLRQIVEDLFEVLSYEDKVNDAADDTFGYSSVHFICTLKEEIAGPRYDGLKGIKIEIQTRTILMDAWANVSHYLAYKGEASIPARLKRDFNALAGLFHVADRQFEVLSDAAHQSDADAVAKLIKPAAGGDESDKGDELEVHIDRSTMTAYLAARYPDREPADPETISEFVEEVRKLGFDTLRDLDRDLDRTLRAALLYEAENPPGPDGGDDEDVDRSDFADSGDDVSSDEGPSAPDDDEGKEPRFAAIGFARLSLALTHPRFRSFFFNRDAPRAKYTALVEKKDSKKGSEERSS